MKEVKILSDWICDGINQKGKISKRDIEYLKQIKVEFEILDKTKKDVQ